MVRRALAFVVAGVLAGAGLSGSPATAAACGPPVASTTQPGYQVADPACDLDGTPFVPINGSTVHTGIRQGAAYRIEVPSHWNGRLVVFAHGYRGTDPLVYVDNPALRAHYLDRGFAWAASSYQTNGYDVNQGVSDSYALIGLFAQVTGHRARSVIMSGLSMGGQITAVAIERYPHTFTGAMPYCGVLGDTKLFDYFLDAGVTAAALAGVATTFPVTTDDWNAQVARMLPALGVSVGAPPSLTTAGRTWEQVVERRTGGVRPGFDNAFATWNTSSSGGLPFLFSVYPGTSGGTIGIATGNVTGNRRTYYRSTDRLFPTAAERALNAEVLRVTPDRNATGIPHVAGHPAIPVLSLHDIGDLFVPISMEQDYAAHGGKFVTRAIRGVSHCDFTQPELQAGFDDLIAWVDGGPRPAGDPILNPAAVADPQFGCRFTQGQRPEFKPCDSTRTGARQPQSTGASIRH